MTRCAISSHHGHSTLPPCAATVLAGSLPAPPPSAFSCTCSVAWSFANSSVCCFCLRSRLSIEAAIGSLNTSDRRPTWSAHASAFPPAPRALTTGKSKRTQWPSSAAFVARSSIASTTSAGRPARSRAAAASSKSETMASSSHVGSMRSSALRRATALELPTSARTAVACLLSEERVT